MSLSVLETEFDWATTRSVLKVAPVSAWLSLMGLAVQGVSALVWYTAGPALASSIPEILTPDWILNGQPWNQAFDAFWLELIMLSIYTACVFIVGLLGVRWLVSHDLKKIRSGVATVIVSALLAWTTGWGLLLGSALMLAGGTVGYAGIRRIHNLTDSA